MEYLLETICVDSAQFTPVHLILVARVDHTHGLVCRIGCICWLDHLTPNRHHGVLILFCIS